MKWTSTDLNKHQVKELERVLNELRSQHNTYTEWTNRYDGNTVTEHKTTFRNLFGSNVRQNLKERMQAVFDGCAGVITPENYEEIRQALDDCLTWAKANIPIIDKRKSLEELKAEHEAYVRRIEDQAKEQIEFEAKSIEIPKGMRGVKLSICYDDSDITTDYYCPHREVESFLLAIIPEGKRLEAILRNVIERIPALKNIGWEWHKEDYSMGHGLYLMSKTSPFPRDIQGKGIINCHGNIEFARAGTRIIPYPEYYLGEINPRGGNGSKVNVEEVTLRENPEFNGLEVIFPCKPEPSIIEELKNLGFRWSFKQGFWYRRNYEGLKEKVGEALKVTT
jgi:hypothetical protein